MHAQEGGVKNRTVLPRIKDSFIRLMTKHLELNLIIEDKEKILCHRKLIRMKTFFLESIRCIPLLESRIQIPVLYLMIINHRGLAH